MGSAECLVVIDFHEDGGGDLHAVAVSYSPLPGETIWFSWEDAAAPGEVVVGPHTEGAAPGAQPEGRFWIRSVDRATKSADVSLQTVERSRSLSADRGKYCWNQVDRPMILMILPPGRPLRFVNPMPMCDGVWERNQRLCLFWGAPPVQTSYSFSLGSPKDSLALNAKRWRRRTRRFRPTSPRQVLVGLGVALLIIAGVAVLIDVFGQAEAAAWAGTGAGAVSVFLAILALFSVRQATLGALSNAA
jgi:hypothetical protein